ncbi:MAG: hypothetical protein GC134_05575 [Proteobacteria bacterium]|nr:hypothetical protein [Pseudomonadota bacterium]
MRNNPLHVVGNIARFFYWPGLIASVALGIATFAYCPFVWAGALVVLYGFFSTGILSLVFMQDIKNWDADRRYVGARAAVLTEPIRRYWSVLNILSTGLAKTGGFGLGLSLAVILTGGLTVAAAITLVPAVLLLLAATVFRLSASNA